MHAVIAGVAATAVMSGVMRLAQAAGALDRPPPATITERMLGKRSRAGTLTNAVRNTAAHAAFGATMALVFDAVRTRLPPALRPRVPVAGALFGLGVWATHYEAVLPALRILPPAHRDRPGRPATMIAAHLVYGSVLELLLRRARTANTH